MNIFKKGITFVKEHPWETAAAVLGSLLIAQTVNAGRIAKSANANYDRAERLNHMIDLVAEAIREGWEIVVDEDNKILDVVLPQISLGPMGDVA